MSAGRTSIQGSGPEIRDLPDRTPSDVTVARIFDFWCLINGIPVVRCWMGLPTVSRRRAYGTHAPNTCDRHSGLFLGQERFRLCGPIDVSRWAWRSEYNANPVDAENRVNVFDSSRAIACQVEHGLACSAAGYDPTDNNWAPRWVAWAPGNRGRGFRAGLWT